MSGLCAGMRDCPPWCDSQAGFLLGVRERQDTRKDHSSRFDPPLSPLRRCPIRPPSDELAARPRPHGQPGTAARDEAAEPGGPLGQLSRYPWLTSFRQVIGRQSSRTISCSRAGAFVHE